MEDCVYMCACVFKLMFLSVPAHKHNIIIMIHLSYIVLVIVLIHPVTQCRHRISLCFQQRNCQMVAYTGYLSVFTSIFQTLSCPAYPLHIQSNKGQLYLACLDSDVLGRSSPGQLCPQLCRFPRCQGEAEVLSVPSASHNSAEAYHHLKSQDSDVIFSTNICPRLEARARPLQYKQLRSESGKQH